MNKIRSLIYACFNNEWGKFLLALFIFFVVILGFYHKSVFQDRLVRFSDKMFQSFYPWVQQKDWSNTENISSGDLLTLQLPNKLVAHKIVKEERTLPFWNPYVMGGVPALADSQSLYCYPPAYLLIFFNIINSTLFYYMFHIFCLLIFTYLSFRIMKVSSFSAITAAIIFAFSPYVFQLFAGFPEYSTFTWLPATFFFWKRTEIEGDYFNKLCLIFFFALSLLGGQFHYFIFLFSGLLIYVYFASDKSLLFKKYKTIFGCFFIALLIAAPQILPFLELSLDSNRPIDAIEGCKISNLMTLVNPDILGSPEINTNDIKMIDGKQKMNYNVKTWQNCVFPNFYFGIVSLVLVSTFLKKIKRSQDMDALLKSAMIFIVFMVLMEYLSRSPLFMAMYGKIPLLNALRSHNRANTWVLFSFAALTACALDLYRTEIKVRLSMIRNLFFFFLPVLSLICIILFIVANKYFMPPDPSDLYFVRFLFKYISASVLILTIFMFLNHLKGINKLNSAPYYAICILMVAELLFFNYPLLEEGNKKVYYPETPSVDFMKDHDKGVYRTMPVQEGSYDAFIAVAPFQMLSGYLLQTAGGYNTIFPGRYKDYIQKIGHNDWSYSELRKSGRYSFNTKLYNSKLIDMLNVKYLLTKRNLEDNGKFKLLYSKDINIYINLGALERAYFVTDHLVMDKSRILDYMLSNSFDPRQTVILEKNIDASRLQKVSKEHSCTVNIKKYLSTRIELEVNTSSPGFLVLADNYYPGWTAFVNGQKTEVLRADYIHRAIYIEPGSHKVAFIFVPYSFYIGCGISFAVFIFLLVTGVSKNLRNIWLNL